MFELALREGIVFQKVVNGFKDLMEAVEFGVTSTGISICAFDKAHVCVVTVSLDSAGFQSFRCDRNLGLPVNTKALSQMLSGCRAGDTLVLSSDDDGDVLSLEMESADKGRCTQYELNCVTPDDHEEVASNPQRLGEYSVVSLGGVELQQVISDFTNIDDNGSLEITVKSNSIDLRAAGDFGTLTTSFRAGPGRVPAKGESGKKTQPVKIALADGDTIRRSFALGYIANFMKAAALCDVSQAMPPLPRRAD